MVRAGVALRRIRFRALPGGARPLYRAPAAPGAMTHLDPGDPRYPALLATIPSPPPLTVRGTLEPGDALAIAIVGARRATAYGLEVAARLAADLAARGVTIVSGLARGIDTASHRAALEAGGRTIAVLGSGADVVYPPENAALAARIAARGALLSQFPAGTPPLPHHFPLRNRTLAGLALGVIVVEAGERSGALITAGFAGDLGREVFAVPGRITSEASRGAHRLLRDGATLVTGWADVVQELPAPWRAAVREAVAPLAAGPAPGTDEARILAALAVDAPQEIDAVIVHAALPPARVAALLIALELDGHVRQLPGQRWVAVGARTRRA
jgi:DNA processing protein